MLFLFSVGYDHRFNEGDKGVNNNKYKFDQSFLSVWKLSGVFLLILKDGEKEFWVEDKALFSGRNNLMT